MQINTLLFEHFETGNDWLGYWGKHMKANCFKAVREYQKVRKSNYQANYFDQNLSVDPLYSIACFALRYM